MRQTAGGSGFELERDYDLTGAVTLGDKIISALPDWSGRLWFVFQQGVVGIVDRASGAVSALPLRERIGNSFAVDETGGVFDLDADGTGCRSVWRSQESAPTVVPKLSAANGIVYTYIKDPQPDGQDAWYLTALDFHTGKTLYKRLGGEGLGHNNNYAPVTLGPDGTAYVVSSGA